jgi:hypothetical protein
VLRRISTDWLAQHLMHAVGSDGLHRTTTKIPADHKSPQCEQISTNKIQWTHQMKTERATQRAPTHVTTNKHRHQNLLYYLSVLHRSGGVPTESCGDGQPTENNICC